MNLYLILLTIFLIFIFKISKRQNLSLLLISLALIILNSDSIEAFFRNIVNIESALLIPETIYWITLLIFAFILSELLHLIGVTSFFEEKIFIFKKEKYNNAIAEILQIFSNTFDLTSISHIARQGKKFYISSFIAPTLFVISIFSGYILFTNNIFSFYNGTSTELFFLVTTFNFVAIWWLVKSIILHLLNINLKTDVDLHLYNNLIPLAQTTISHHVKNKYAGRIILITILGFIIAILISIFTTLALSLVFIIYLFLLIIFYSIVAEILAYRTKEIEEKEIFAAYRRGFNTIFKKLVQMVIILIFAITLFNFFDGKYNLVYLNWPITIASIIFILTISMFSIKYYYVSFILLIPYLELFINFFNFTNNFGFISVAIALNCLLFLQILFLQTNKFKKLSIFLDNLYLVTVVSILFTIYIITNNYLLVALAFLFLMLIYIILAAIGKKYHAYR